MTVAGISPRAANTKLRKRSPDNLVERGKLSRFFFAKFWQILANWYVFEPR